MSEKTADKLIVTFDRDPKGLDEPCLVVGRKLTDGTIEIINTLKGEDANTLYDVITTWKGCGADGTL